MLNDFRTATTGDIREVKSIINSLRTEAVLDIAYVTDANHNNYNRTDLGIGDIKGKSEKDAGKNQSVDLVYKPITENLKHYPIPGEYVLVIRTSVGNFYLTSLNINRASNNNIDKTKIISQTKYDEDSYTSPSEIKISKGRTSVLDKIDTPDFRIKTVPKRQLNYGDVVLEGRFGNTIHLSYSPNSNAMLQIENLNSSILMFNDTGAYSRITQNTYNEVVEKEFNKKLSGEHLILNSDRIILYSQGNGIFLQSKGNSIGMVSDKDIDISSERQLSLNGDIILLGTNKNEQPLVRGREFGTQWGVLIQLLHEVATAMKNQAEVATLTGIGNLISKKLDDGIASAGISNIKAQSLSKFLSEEVYIR